MVEEEETTSDTRLKLEEASYFFDQMKSNLDNRKYFMFNVIAFVSAGRSVTFVMQHEFKKKKGETSKKWYQKNVEEALEKEEVPAFFRKLRNVFLKEEGNPRQYLLKTVSKTMTFKYHIIGSAIENEVEEELTEHNYERESAPPTIAYKPAAQDPTLKYVWYIQDIKDKTIKRREYVIPSCEQYLQRLTDLVNECERLFN
jgi:hypothetical protein